MAVYRATWNDGHVTFQQTQQAQTDDRGKFRIGMLPPGGYFVCATPNGGSAVPSTGPVDLAVRGEPRYYQRTCSPDPHAASARPLSLLPGRQQEVQLTLRASAGAELQGRVRNLPPGVGTGVMLSREGGFEGEQPLVASVGTEGKFAFRGVPPGEYRLEASVTRQSGDGFLLIGRLPVEVAGGGTQEIELPLAPPVFFNVVIHGVPAVPERLTVGLRSQWDTTWADSNAGGPLHFTSLVNGPYWLVTRTDPHTCVQSAKVGEQDALGGPIAIHGAGQLDLTLSTHCGGIQARAVSDGKPVPDAKVLLLVSGSPKDPGNLLHDFADDEGEAYFDGLKPGRYLLWAWTVDTAGGFVGPADLAGAAAKATEVTVTAGEPVKVDVTVIPREEP